MSLEKLHPDRFPESFGTPHKQVAFSVKRDDLIPRHAGSSEFPRCEFDVGPKTGCSRIATNPLKSECDNGSL